MSGSRRPRRRSKGSRSTTTSTLVALAVLVIVVPVLPAASVSHGAVPRGSGADTVADHQGVHDLDTASEVRINHTDVLTNVTNRWGQTVTVTVTLRGDSDHIGDLVVGGTTVGNETSFTLGDGERKAVSIEIPDNQSLTDEVVYFHVETSEDGIIGSTPDRTVPVNE